MSSSSSSSSFNDTSLIHHHQVPNMNAISPSGSSSVNKKGPSSTSNGYGIKAGSACSIFYLHIYIQPNPDFHVFIAEQRRPKNKGNSKDRSNSMSSSSGASANDISPNPLSASILRPEEGLLEILKEHVNPIIYQLPVNVSLENLEEFLNLYSNHCSMLMSYICQNDFISTEACIKQFWGGLNKNLLKEIILMKLSDL